MPARRRRFTAAARAAGACDLWWKVAACLFVFTAWVHWWFVPRVLAPRYRDAFPILRDRTLGTNLAVLFALLPPPGTDVVVTLVGDSSVGGALYDQNLLSWKLRAALRARYPGRHIDVVDLTLVGLRAPDALVFVAKALAIRPSLVVYAMSPRVAPVDVELMPSVGDAVLQPDVVARVGLPMVLALVDPAALGRSLVHSLWLPARLRLELRDAALARVGIGSPRSARVSAPPAATREGMRMLRAAGDGEYLWPRAAYALDPPTRSSRALAALIELCAREGACLLYQVPVNPAAERGFEPGMVDGFVDRVGALATAAGAPFRDCRDAAAPADFAVNSRGDRDAIHLTPAGLDRFAPGLAEMVAARLDARGG